MVPAVSCLNLGRTARTRAPRIDPEALLAGKAGNSIVKVAPEWMAGAMTGALRPAPIEASKAGKTSFRGGHENQLVVVREAPFFQREARRIFSPRQSPRKSPRSLRRHDPDQGKSFGPAGFPFGVSFPGPAVPLTMRATEARITPAATRLPAFSFSPASSHPAMTATTGLT